MIRVLVAAISLAQRIQVQTRMVKPIGDEKQETRSSSTADAIGIFDRVK